MLSCGQGVYRGADPTKALSKALKAADDQPPQEKSPGSPARDQPRCLTAWLLLQARFTACTCQAAQQTMREAHSCNTH